MAEKKKISAVIGRLKGQKKTTVQTIIFSPKSAWTAEDCKAWLTDHGFKAGAADETENSFRFRQRDPGDFQEGSFRTINFKGGKKSEIARDLQKAIGTRVSGLAQEVHGPFVCMHCVYFCTEHEVPEGFDGRCESGLVALDPEVPEDEGGNKVVRMKQCCADYEPSSEEEAAVATKLQKFIPFQKVDSVKREVWGIVTAEVPDKDDEVCDYAKSKPFYEAVIDEMRKATEDKSFFPLREMHQLSAVGKGVGFEFRDADKEIFMGFKVVDDDAWKKVEEGVYTGFSQGGSVVGDKVPDPVFKGCMRYVASPSEVSLVDNPCLGIAHFAYVKADGTMEMRKNKSVADPLTARVQQIENELRLLKKAGAPTIASSGKTKLVDGEALQASSFAHVGDPEKPETWVLPLKTKRRIRDAIVRMTHVSGKAKNIPPNAKASAWTNITVAAEKNRVDMKKARAQFDAVQLELRKRCRASVNKLMRKTADVGHALTFLDDNLGRLAKGLPDAGRLACYVQELGYMLYGVIAEEQWEKDDSSALPSMLMDNIDDLLDTLIAMVAEESQELREELTSRMKPV